MKIDAFYQAYIDLKKMNLLNLVRVLEIHLLHQPSSNFPINFGNHEMLILRISFKMYGYLFATSISNFASALYGESIIPTSTTSFQEKLASP